MPTDTADHWLDSYAHPAPPPRRLSAHSWISRTLVDQPRTRLRRAGRFLRTTPGTMLAVTITLCLALLASGLAMSYSSAARQEELGTLLSTTEPTAYAAHTLHASLSLADTVATTSMVKPPTTTSTEPDAYFRALDDASVAAARVASGIREDDAESAALITSIQRQLPVYAGIIETARTHSRQGNPVAISYMAEASWLMRQEILRPARQLFERLNQDVVRQRHALSIPQWIPLAGLVLVLGALVVAQGWLYRITRRRLNRGFVGAMVLMTLSIVWVLGTNLVTWQAGTRGFDRAAEPWTLLTEARIAAQEARTVETMALVRRETTAASATRFDEAADTIGGALGSVDDATSSSTAAPGDQRDAVLRARAAQAEWSQSHDRLIDALDRGDFSAALDTTNSRTLVESFTTLDEALADLVAESRSTLRSFLNRGLTVTRIVATSVWALAVLAAVFVVFGIRPRLQEYL